MGVGQIDLKRQLEAIRSEVAAAVKAVLESGQYVMGAEVEAFERETAAYCGAEHAIACANGTDAIMLALTALDIGPGDEVITTPFTFFGTVSPIVHRGATPVLPDIDPASYCLDPELVRAAITPKTKAIMPVHLYGNMHGVQELAAIAEEHGVALIEDAAQAIGAREKGKRAGSIGTVSIFSFYPTKNLAAMGDGGLLTTNDATLADRLRGLRNHGEREKYTHHEFGFNSRLDALQAAILRIKLRHLEKWITARREVAYRYDRLFKESGLTKKKRVKIPARQAQDGKSDRHVFHQYTIRCDEREKLRAHLAEKGIGAGVHYPRVVYKQPAFEKLGIKPSCPNAEAAAAAVLSLPMFAELTETEQRSVVDAITEFYR